MIANPLSSRLGFGSTTYRTCPLCGGHPCYVNEPCGHCYAPTEVIRSISSRDHAPRFVGIVGPSGVGKTVYLGMLLDMLMRGAGGLRGMPHGSFSMSLHRNVILALERQRFPAKTPAEPDRWDWVHCEVGSDGKRAPAIDIVTPDVAGD